MGLWDKKRGPRTIGAIEPEDVLDLLNTLVAKSIVLYDEASGRYRLLESVRQYGVERLVDRDESEPLRARHMQHFLAVAEEAGRRLAAEDQSEWLEKLEVEHENLRAALEWTLTAPAVPSSVDLSYSSQKAAFPSAFGLSLAGTLWRFWMVRGYIHEGRQWLDDLLAAEND